MPTSNPTSAPANPVETRRVVGGIGSVDDAWERIRAGASLVQVYSAMVYAGPGLGRVISGGLARKLAQHGMGSIAEAVGSE